MPSTEASIVPIEVGLGTISYNAMSAAAIEVTNAISRQLLFRTPRPRPLIVVIGNLRYRPGAPPLDTANRCSAEGPPTAKTGSSAVLFRCGARTRRYQEER